MSSNSENKEFKELSDLKTNGNEIQSSNAEIVGANDQHNKLEIHKYCEIPESGNKIAAENKMLAERNAIYF